MRFTDLPTPCFIIDENRLVQNLAVLRDVARRSGAKILLAQKAFSMFSTYPLLREYLAGTTASGLFEARLGHEEFGGETHVYSPAYTPDEFHEILNYADHIVFNSFTQWKKYGNLARVAGKSCGLRLNPECSTQPDDHAIYDPCGPTSRLGITEANFQPDLLDGIEGFHFHTLCEQNADDLVRTVAAFEMRFGRYMEGMKWLNLGGGHHITRADSDVDALVSTVLETMKNRKDIAILDTSAACHMPDVLEMPYRPPVMRAGEPGCKAFDYLLTGRTCLAGDVIGEYSFDVPLMAGEQVVFEDMALYTMVKTNTFNGMPLPLIAVRRADGTDEVVRMFSYEDFKNRLS